MFLSVDVATEVCQDPIGSQLSYLIHTFMHSKMPLIPALSSMDIEVSILTRHRRIFC